MGSPRPSKSWIVLAPERVHQPITTVGSWALPKPIDSDASFAAEALRFAGWLSTPRPEYSGQPWSPISDAELAKALEQAHRSVHDQLLRWLWQIRTDVGTGGSAECAGVEVMTRAFGMLRPVPSPPPPPKSDAKNKKAKAPLPPFAFEAAWTDFDNLGTTCEWNAAKKALLQAFGSLDPVPGGTLVISRPGYPQVAANGWEDRGDTDITLSEKIYREARALAAGSATVVPTLPSRFLPAGRSAAAAARVRELYESIGMKRIEPWSSWLAQIDVLDAILRPLVGEAPGTDEAKARVACDVGIPWSLALAARARQTICDALRLVFVLALPIDGVHRAVDGLVAAALVEARLQRPEYLTKAACGSLAWMSVGRTGAAIDRWSALPASKAVLDGLQERPVWRYPATVIKAGKRERITGLEVVEKSRSGKPPSKGLRPGVLDPDEPRRVDLESEANSWPSFGAVQLTDLLRTSEHRFHFGATSFAALHLTVAARRLLDARDDDERDRINFLDANRVPNLAAAEDAANKGPRCGGRIAMVGPPQRSLADDPDPPLLGIGAGSLFRGGRHKPHITHSLGDCFDVSLPHATLAWDPYRFEDRVDDAKAAENHEKMGTIWRVVRTEAERKQEPPRRVISKDLKTRILEEFGRIRSVLPKPDEPGALDRSALQHATGAAQRALAGLPDFPPRYRREMVAGHLAILLSFPNQILFSSPVTHLHALRILAEVAFSQDALDENGRAVVRQLFKPSVFAFFPTDHHNHWHVVYSPWLKPPQPQQDPPPKKTAQDEEMRKRLGARGLVVSPKRKPDDFPKKRMELADRGLVLGDRSRLVHLQLAVVGWAALGVGPRGILRLHREARAKTDDRSRTASAAEDHDINRAFEAVPDNVEPGLLKKMFARVATDETLGEPESTNLGPVLEQAVSETKRRLEQLGKDLEEDDEDTPLDLEEETRIPLP
ncbi:MAG: hypothetical protein ABMB14_08765 [Myxococcota bacterium]